MRKTILIVSDKLAIYEPIWLNAADAGYEPSVVDGYHEASRVVSHMQPSVLIMDSDISGVSAASLLKGIRLSLHTRHLAVIVVASKDYEYEHLPMFEAGADDIVGVPFSVREVFARIKAVTRPRTLKVSATPISVGTVTIDPDARRVFVRNGEKDIEVTMRPTTFEILRLLAMRAGSVLARDEILSSVWGPTASVGIRSVDVQINFLRNALRDSDTGLQIDAVPGRGYRLAITDMASHAARTVDK
jgi:two-component system alkaline phosphatase synthesis response regulator PhoP